MKGRRSSAVPLLRRNSDSFTQSIDSDPSKCLNVELLQPTIQEKEEEPSVFIDNDCLEKHPHCMSVPDKYNTNYVTVSGIKSGDISSTYDALPCNWINYVKMLAACITFLPVGMATTIVGATLLELKSQTETSSTDMALLFTWRGLGAMAGTVLVGVVYNKMKPEVLLCIGVVALGLGQIAMPVCSSYAQLVAAITCSGISIGLLGSGLNAYVVELWKSRSAPFTQVLHFSISCGSMLGPLISTPFLEYSLASTENDLYETAQNLTAKPLDDILNTQRHDVQDDVANIFSEEDEMGQALSKIGHMRSDPHLGSNETQHLNDTVPLVFDKDITNQLFYPYMIIAVICLLASVFYVCILFCRYQKQQKVFQVDADTSEKSSIISTKIYQTIGLVLLNTMCILSGSMEGAFGGYIAVYGVKQLEMTFSTAALLATTFWGCFALGRGLSILLVQYFKSHIIIYSDWAIVSLSLFACFMFDHLHIAVAFICCSLIGFALSTILGNVLSYTNTNLVISAQVTATYVISFYVGVMGCPSVVGFLMDMYMSKVMLYFLFAMSILAMILFSVLHFVVIKRCTLTMK